MAIIDGYKGAVVFNFFLSSSLISFCVKGGGFLYDSKNTDKSSSGNDSSSETGVSSFAAAGASVGIGSVALFAEYEYLDGVTINSNGGTDLNSDISFTTTSADLKFTF